MTTPRDTRRPLEFWNDRLASKHKYFHSKDQVADYKKRIKDDCEPWKAIEPLTGAYTDHYLEDVAYRYCRGDSLDEIRKDQIDEGIDRFVYACDEIDRMGDALEVHSRYWQSMLFYPNDVHSAYCIVSWFVCFEADPHKLGRIAPRIAIAGKDRLIDTILQRYQPDREIAAEDRCGRTFKLLQSVMDVDKAKAIKNLEKYLATWGKLMGTLKGLRSIGVAGTERAKSNESLIANLDTIKNVSYCGFWAWEVALVVRIFDVSGHLKVTSVRGH